MDADGTGARRLAQRGSEPVWSPDGRIVAYSGHGGAVWVVEADSGTRRRLTYDWRPNASYGGLEPAWSPDGRQIAYEKVFDFATEVWVTDPSADSPHRLTHGWNPVWSPGGDLIAYVNRSVMVMDADGADRRLVTDDFGWSLAWSPGRSHLAYSTVCDGRSEVWVVDVASSESWLLAEGAYRPAWSPYQGR